MTCSKGSNGEAKRSLRTRLWKKKKKKKKKKNPLWETGKCTWKGWGSLATGSYFPDKQWPAKGGNHVAGKAALIKAQTFIKTLSFQTRSHSLITTLWCWTRTDKTQITNTDWTGKAEIKKQSLEAIFWNTPGCSPYRFAHMAMYHLAKDVFSHFRS